MKTLIGCGLLAIGTVFTSQPAAAQTAQNPSCVAGPWTVFFTVDSDEVTPSAAAILNAVANAYRTCGSVEVEIAGHTDRKASVEYNVGLSQRMAANVRSYLAGRGVPDGVMTTQAFGESRPLINTKDGVSEPQNRRVEIQFRRPSSGW